MCFVIRNCQNKKTPEFGLYKKNCVSQGREGEREREIWLFRDFYFRNGAELIVFSVTMLEGLFVMYKGTVSNTMKPGYDYSICVHHVWLDIHLESIFVIPAYCKNHA